MNIKRNQDLVKKAKNNIDNLDKEYTENNKCGNFAIIMNYFRGGITSKKVITEDIDKYE